MKTFGLTTVLLACAMASAQVPAPQQVESELASPFATAAAKPALTQRGALCKEIEPLLIKQASYLVSTLLPWEKDAQALSLTASNSSEADIRPNAHTAYGLAVLYRSISKGYPPDFSPDAAKAKAIAILRFVLPAHGAGGLSTNNGKQWKNQWQSALWAYSAGKAAWLLWDDLTPQMKWLAARMICDEADRFVGVTPPAQVVNDTKAEENAWNSRVIALAYNMFPHHPHHEAWRETAIRWQITSFAAAKDLDRTDAIEGKPLKDWLTKANIYDDYTLENHGRVHPDYMTTITINLFQRLVYDWGGNHTPDSIGFNAEKTYASIKKLCLPDGGYIYPNAQDWQLHRNADWLDCHLAMAVLYSDPQAARLARICLETARKMIARSPDGGIYSPGETRFASSQGMLLELYADAYLLMAARGEGAAPVPEDQLWHDLSGRHLFSFGQFGVLRTELSVSTFSWGRQVMGMVMPLGKDLLLSPNDRGLIGIVQAEGQKRDTPIMKQVKVIDIPDALAVVGVLDRGKGQLEQRFAFLALPDGRTVYADVVKETASKSTASGRFGTLGVLNDRNWVHHNGRRTLHYDGGQHTFLASEAESDSPLEMTSNWYSLDGLGIAVLAASGPQRYEPKPTGAAGRLEQLFHLNCATGAYSSPLIAQTALVFYPAQDWQQTRAAAAKCRRELKADLQHFTLTLDDGLRVAVDLEKLTLTAEKP